jgi:AcrR family transcriptional regulator
VAGKRAEILDTAVQLADERGLAAVSMRAIAERVGVTPMALYPYIGNKTALLDAMLGYLLSQLQPARAAAAPAAGTGQADGGSGAVRASEPDEVEGAGPADGTDGAGAWPEQLAAIARAARAMVTAHPWAAELVFTRPAITPDSVRAVDLLYTALLDAGVPPGEVPRVERMLSTVVIGFAASEAGGRFGTERDPRGFRGNLPDGALPGHAQLAAALERPVDWDAEFEADIADLALLIQTIARRGATGAAGRS